MGWDGGSSIVMYRTVVLPVVVVRCWLLRIVLRRQKICFEFYSKYRRSNTVIHSSQVRTFSTRQAGPELDPFLDTFKKKRP